MRDHRGADHSLPSNMKWYWKIHRAGGYDGSKFLKEGTAIANCMRPERIVVGTDKNEYEPFNRNHDRMILMDICSAELTKYVANCMLTTKISFMNEIANLAELLGADMEKLRQGIGSDSHISYSFIYPGCGYGGSYFPKDVQALI